MVVSLIWAKVLANTLANWFKPPSLHSFFVNNKDHIFDLHLSDPSYTIGSVRSKDRETAYCPPLPPKKTPTFKLRSMIMNDYLCFFLEFFCSLLSDKLE